MNKWAWWNPYLPQTLLVSVALAYFGLGITVLFNGILALTNLIVFIPLALSVVGAFGIVNLRMWGYIAALFSALLPFGLVILLIFTSDITFADYLDTAVFGPDLINTIFEVVIVALLVHPMSLDYVRNNFQKKIF